MRLRFIGLALLLLFARVGISSAFMVPLKDGTSKDVSKIEFRGTQADLYMNTGMVMTVPTEGIDFRSMGLERPAFPFGVCTDGRTVQRRSVPAEKGSAAPAVQDQKELSAAYEKSTETAVATRDSGSILKGQTVHVVDSNDLSVTLVIKDDDGQYRKVVMSYEMYQENFQVPKQKPAAAPAAPAPVVQPAKPEASPAPAPVPASEPEPQAPAPSRIRLVIPAAMSFGILLAGMVITVIASKMDQGKPRRKPKCPGSKQGSRN